MAHPWSKEDRIVLCLLKRFHLRKEIARLFNYLRKQNSLPGDRNYIRIETLETQFHTTKNGGKDYDVFHKIDGLGDITLK